MLSESLHDQTPLPPLRHFLAFLQMHTHLALFCHRPALFCRPTPTIPSIFLLLPLRQDTYFMVILANPPTFLLLSRKPLPPLVKVLPTIRQPRSRSKWKINTFWSSRFKLRQIMPIWLTSEHCLNARNSTTRPTQPLPFPSMMVVSP